jgi:3-oxoacyl-[acyl-carrier protein] reductase
VSEPRFDGRVAFITGGAIGFGRAFGRALASEGASVAVADIDLDAARVTAAALSATGSKAMAVRCDVADDAQVVAAVKAVSEELGPVAVLINNAGKHLTRYNRPFSVMPRDDLRELFDVNVIGVVNCTVACREPMRSVGGGVVLNIASIAGHVSTTPYGVSKLAVRGLTIAFASELAPDNIRVNAIAPGLMATENALVDLPQSMVDEFVGERQLVHRLGLMEDIVQAMLYLCSDQASFVTGQTLDVSGGFPLYI